MNRFLLVFALFCTFSGQLQAQILRDKIICIDPGHGGTAATDNYRVGPAGEREEWINLRVALLLQKLLAAEGAKVIMTRTEDVQVPLADRARLAREANAQLFISIHHNATADSSVNFPIIYFHGNGSENKGSVAFGKLLANELLKNLHKPGSPVSLVSDFTIFAELGASVLRNSYGIPGVLAEASFFTNAAEEQRLKTAEHNALEAKAYFNAITAFFSESAPEIIAKNSVVPAIPVFKVFQEAERMTPIAKRWHKDFEEAEMLLATNDTASNSKAFELFTRSAKSFPDSYVAAKCHQRRAEILLKWNQRQRAAEEKRRFAEYYIP